MTLPPSIRIFFAIDLPEPVREKVSNFAAQLKKRARTNGIRWSRPENLHITLQFLDQVKSTDLPKLMSEVRDSLLANMSPFLVELGNLHLFPSAFHPRVIVLDVTPQETLAGLSAQVGKGIVKAGYDIEDRPFRAHLTLGRIKNRRVDTAFLSEFTMPPVEPIQVNQVVLFRSEPMPDASRYTRLDEIDLNSKAII